MVGSPAYVVPTDDMLFTAAGDGNVEAVKLALVMGAAVKGTGVLQWAAENGRTEVVRILLAEGADVHGSDDAALKWAAFYGFADVVRILLTAGADPVVAWSSSAHRHRTNMIPTLEACADAMTPVQCATLAAKSRKFKKLAALVASSRHHQQVCRR